MSRQPRSMRGRCAGFTLIEIAIVLAILSVAAALVLPAVGRGRESLRIELTGFASTASKLIPLLESKRWRS